MEQILQQFICTISGMAESDQSIYIDLYKKLTIVSVKKKNLLLEYGEKCKYLWFIGVGFGRYRVTKDNGEIYTTNFFQEGDFVTDKISLFESKPSQSEIEIIEDIMAIRISKENLMEFYESVPDVNKIMKGILDKCYNSSQLRMEHLAYHDKANALQALVEVFPNIQNRVSQRMIASYLDISPVQLSRLKGKNL